MVAVLALLGGAALLSNPAPRSPEGPDGPRPAAPDARADRTEAPDQGVAPSSDARSDPAPAAQAPPTLFSLRATEDGCRWETRRPPDDAPTLLRVTDVCPDDILWSSEPGTDDLVYRVDRSLVRIDPTGSSPVELPREPGEWLVDFWIDASTDRPRVAYMVDVECVLDGERCSYDVGDRTIQSVRPEGEFERFAVVDGFAVVASEEDAHWHLPTWGSRMVALEYEENVTGGWSLVSAMPTRAEAGDTPGIGVLGIEKSPAATSFAELSAAGTCMGHLGAATGCDRRDGELPEALEAGLGGEYYELRGLVGAGTEWLFPVVYFDSPHIVGPVYEACGEGCEPTPLAIAERGLTSLALGTRGPFLLVTRGYDGRNGLVFTAGSTEPALTLPAEARTVWLPG